MSADFKVEKWLDRAVSGIRFGPDRRAVRAELEGHLEDKILDLQRIFPDIPEDEARARALAGMGDPEEVRAELARVHKPWLGWLWRFSQVLAAGLLAAVVLLYGGRAVENYRPPQGEPQPPYGDYLKDCYQAGIDPFRADGPYPDKGDGVLRTPLAALRPEGSVRTGFYRFRVERAGLFLFQNGPEDPGNRWLFCELRAAGPPWEPAAQSGLWYLRAVDSTGREYASSYEVYDLREEHESHVMAGGTGTAGLERSFDIDIVGVSPEAEWIRLEYDRLGVRWSLTIPLAAEGGGTSG